MGVCTKVWNNSVDINWRSNLRPEFRSILVYLFVWCCCRGYFSIIFVHFMVFRGPTHTSHFDNTAFWHNHTGIIDDISSISSHLILIPFLCIQQSLVIYFLILSPSKRQIFQSLAFFAGENIYTNIGMNSNPRYIRVCDQSAVKLLKSTLAMLGIIFTFSTISVIFPLYAYVVKNDIQLPVPILLPFTDLESRLGIILNLLNQVFIAWIGVAGNKCVEFFVFLSKF